MTAGVGNKIQVGEYDTIRNKVNLVFGTGSSGYGQTTTSPTISVGSQITAAQWIALRNDMVKCRQHQTGSAVGTTSATDGANLLVPASGAQITESLRNQFDLFADTITSNKFAVHASQLSLEALTTGTRATAWNNTLTHTATITGNTGGGGSALNMAYFFNAGGSIVISATRTGGSATSKNTTWNTMFTQMGNISMNYTQTTYSGASGTGSAIGWQDLTTSNQVIFQKTAPAGSYAENLYVIRARRDAASTQLILTIEFQDNDAGDPTVDENVDGTLSSIVQMNRPSGSNVSVLAPTAVSSGM